jgi:hypothetical protein
MNKNIRFSNYIVHCSSASSSVLNSHSYICLQKNQLGSKEQENCFIHINKVLNKFYFMIILAHEE